MRKSIKRITAVVSAAILGALPIAGSFITSASAESVYNIRFVFGDVNGDNRVNIIDASKISGYIGGDVNAHLTAEQKRRADVNGDGKVTAKDMHMIMTFSNNLMNNTNVKDAYGDANGDGEANILDAYMIDSYARNKTGAGKINLMAADLNGDGHITTFDAQIVAHYDDDCKFLDTLYINWGDVDGNGRVESEDARLVAQYVGGNVNAQLEDVQKKRVDFDFDGKVTAADYKKLLRWVADGYVK